MATHRKYAPQRRGKIKQIYPNKYAGSTEYGNPGDPRDVVGNETQNIRCGQCGMHLTEGESTADLCPNCNSTNPRNVKLRR